MMAECVSQITNCALHDPPVSDAWKDFTFSPLIGSQMLQPDGGPPREVEYSPDLGGAGKNASVWGHPQCPTGCAGEDELKAAACLPADDTRFYEGGPVVGGFGRKPILGKDYINKRAEACYGQRYAGAYLLSPTAGKPSAVPAGFRTEGKIKPGQSENVELKGLMERVQQYIFRFRLRVKDFFKDFDPLNHGFISANRFRRVLSVMGIGRGGKLFLSEGELDALLNFYRLEHDQSMVCWRKFDADVESIFLQRGLEKMPLALTPLPDRIANLPNPGETNMEDVPLRIRQLARCAISRLKSRVELERCNLKYFFRGFDRINNGHVTLQQFKQTLSMLNYHFTADELDAMSVQYGDVMGFDYLKLLEDIEPRDKSPPWYQKYKVGRLYQLTRKRQDWKPEEECLNRIMYKIQARMVRRRPKLGNFLRDHDYHNHDRIKIIDFHRAMDRSGFELTPREVEYLICCFRSPDDPEEIEWRCFLNAIETVFTIQNLDKGVRIFPKQWRPMKEMDYEKTMEKTEWCLYVQGMRRLAQKAYQRRLHIRPMFQDFDIPQGGYVSENQFHRVLHTIGLGNMVTTSELEAIMRRFGIVRGHKKEVDYRSFLKGLDEIADKYPITLEEMSPTGVKWYEQLEPCGC